MSKWCARCVLLFQAAVIVLNKYGWVGYLVPHASERKFYCHYHYQQRMDPGEKNVVRWDGQVG